jgi:hypothetical protein
MRLPLASANLLRRAIALPSDHGAWVFLLSPLLIGLFIGGRWNAATGWLLLGAFAAFLLRQPVSHAVKVLSNRRPRADGPAALFWSALYSLLGFIALGGLVANGAGFVLWLALPAWPVFFWHLWLISRRAERRQMGVEIVGSGVLALAAPAALWVATGAPAPAGWGLWLLTWMQSAASIVYAYLRLEQRVLRQMPSVAERLRMAHRALLYTGTNTLLVAVCGLGSLIPPGLWAAFGLQLAETLWGALRPAAGLKPAQIGIRQTVVSALFTLAFVWLWGGQ